MLDEITHWVHKRKLTILSSVTSANRLSCAVVTQDQEKLKVSIYIFTRDHKSWLNYTDLLIHRYVPVTGCNFSIALSGDGNTCAIATATDESTRASIYIFTKSVKIIQDKAGLCLDRHVVSWDFQSELISEYLTIDGKFDVYVAFACSNVVINFYAKPLKSEAKTFIERFILCPNTNVWVADLLNFTNDPAKQPDQSLMTCLRIAA